MAVMLISPLETSPKTWSRKLIVSAVSKVAAALSVVGGRVGDANIPPATSI
jgi:hypothetical protein